MPHKSTVSRSKNKSAGACWLAAIPPRAPPLGDNDSWNDPLLWPWGRLFCPKRQPGLRQVFHTNADVRLATSRSNLQRHAQFAQCVGWFRPLALLGNRLQRVQLEVLVASTSILAHCVSCRSAAGYVPSHTPSVSSGLETTWLGSDGRSVSTIAHRTTFVLSEIVGLECGVDGWTSYGVCWSRNPGILL